MRKRERKYSQLSTPDWRERSFKKECGQIAWTAGFSLLEEDGRVYKEIDGMRELIADGERLWYRTYMALQPIVDAHPEWNWCALVGTSGTTSVGKLAKISEEKIEKGLRSKRMSELEILGARNPNLAKFLKNWKDRYTNKTFTMSDEAQQADVYEGVTEIVKCMLGGSSDVRLSVVTDNNGISSLYVHATALPAKS